jgi:hypothetical protein
MKTIAVLFAVLLASATAVAQDVSIGSLHQDNGQSTIRPSEATTWINLAAPATASGTINTVTLRWFVTGPGCQGGFRIRFFRRSNPTPSVGGNGVFTATATRGPFNAVNGQITVALSPAVQVSAGDYIGIVQTAGGTCGGVQLTGGGATLQSAFIRGDAEVVDLRIAETLNLALQARGSTTGRVLEGIIAAAGSLPGANGSFFRTSVHLANPESSQPVSGELVFHPAGRPAAAGDPKLPFTIAPRAVVFFGDVVAAMGQTGLGSIDLYTTSSVPPRVNVRVFNDQGPLGTAGFTMDLIPPTQALNRGTGTLAMSAGTAYRTNFGIRSVGGATKVQFAYYNASGTLVQNAIPRDLAADTFEQVSFAQLFGLSIADTPGYVKVFLLGGSPAIVYASTTDNRTNDSSIQFVRSNGD